MSKPVELTLKHGESVRIGPVRITNIGLVTGRGIRLGFDAPREVKVLRGELVRKEAERE